MSLPAVVSQEEWLRARRDLLTAEKELTRARDALSTRRRELPMVEVAKDYVFSGASGAVGLADLFEGRTQLILVSFMFDPSWEDGCSSCTAGAEELADGTREHLAVRDTTIAYVSRAPLAKLERWKDEHGWTFPWYSTDGGDFTYDFRTTLDASVAPVTINFSETDAIAAEDQPLELPSNLCFLRVDDRVFFTYQSFARGQEWTGGSYAWLDLTALGRQEDWEQPAGRSDDVRGARPNFAS